MESARPVGNGQAVVATGSTAWILMSDGAGGYASAELPEIPQSADSVGDLDGDGVFDVSVLTRAADRSYTLTLYAGPLEASLPEASLRARATGLDWDEYQNVHWGDVDGDGAPDLVFAVEDATALSVVLGPDLLGTDGPLGDLPAAQLDIGGRVLGGIRTLADPFGTGRDAIAVGGDVLVFDGLTGPTTPMVVVSAPWAGSVAAPSGGRTLVLVDGYSAGRWYDVRSPTQQPPAAFDVDTWNIGSGRFCGGDPDPVDIVAVNGATLHVVRAWDQPAGLDLDRDGSAAPDDYDDADPDVRPGTWETTDGRDED